MYIQLNLDFNDIQIEAQKKNEVLLFYSRKFLPAKHNFLQKHSLFNNKNEISN